MSEIKTYKVTGTVTAVVEGPGLTYGDAVRAVTDALEPTGMHLAYVDAVVSSRLGMFDAEPGRITVRPV